MAKLVYQDIIFAFQEAQQKVECQLFMPSFIRIGNEAFFYDDLYRDEITAGFEISDNLK
jgi:ABC-type antimicrobial peptide transport system permease subunit